MHFINIVINFCLFVIVLLAYVETCNEAICAPRVSKCMLIESCNCSMTPNDLRNKNCTCCKDCHQCLAELFTDCCSCVGLCKPPKDLDPSLIMQSYIEDLESDDDQNVLFETLTEDPDPHLRWTSYIFPAIQTAGFTYREKTQGEPSDLQEILKDVNCTVAFMSQCSAYDKCRRFCSSMGASSYRWFHNGCCECVGRTCLNYGIRTAKCAKCPDVPTDYSFEENDIGKSEL